MKVLSVALLLMASVVIVLMGCKKDDAPTATTTAAIPPELVAAWATQRATLDGVATPVGPTLSRTKSKRASLTISQTGSFTLQQFDSTNSVIFDLAGTVEVVGEKFTLHGTWLDGAQVYEYDFVGPITWSVSGNELLTTFHNQALIGMVVVTWAK